MTDEQRDKALIADIDAISASLPSIPDSYGELRALLARLPSPTLPDIRSARAGAADSLVVSSFGASAVNSPLSGQPIGQESGGSVGIEGLLTFGQGNLLADPALEQMGSTATTLGLAATTVGAFWRGLYVVNSGAGPTIVDFARIYERQIDVANNPFSSSEAEMRLASPASATNWDVYLWPLIGPAPGSDYGPGEVPFLPFLIAGCKVRRKTAANLPAGYTVTVRMQLFRVGDATVVAESTPIDYSTLTDFDDVRLTWAAGAQDAATWAANTYRWRLKISVVNTGASASGTFKIGFGEPVLQWSFVATLPPYSPYIGGWMPNRVVALYNKTGNYVVQASRTGDANDRLRILVDGDMQWGSGTVAPDLRVLRSAAGVLRFDNAAGGRAALEGAAGTGPGTPAAGFGRLYFSSADKHWHQVDDAGVDTDLAAAATQVSRDAAAAAADYVARIRLSTDTTYRAFLGLTAGDVGTLELGPGGTAAPDVRIYRSAAKTLTLDDGAAGPLTEVAAFGLVSATVGFATKGATYGYLQFRRGATLGALIDHGTGGGSTTRLGNYGTDAGPTFRPAITLNADATQALIGFFTTAPVTKRTGWAAATGTATRTTFATSTVTTAQLAERVKALIDDLIAYGLIGA